MAQLYGQLCNLNLNSELSIQNINNTCIRIDMLNSFNKDQMFLQYSPIMFFLLSPESDLVKMELMTYNEQVFDILNFNGESSGDLYSFILNKFKNVTFSCCSGVKKENIKPRKLKKYLTDNDTLFEKFGDNLIFRSINCRRIIENQSNMDLCSNCKIWLISKETNSKLEMPPEYVGVDLYDDSPPENPYVKVKYESSDEDFGAEKNSRKSFKKLKNNLNKKIKSNKSEANLTNGCENIKIEVSESDKRPAEISTESESKQSLIWKYFTVNEEDEKKGVCNICNALVDCAKKNDSAMLRHLLRLHPETDIVKHKKESCQKCGKKFLLKGTLIKHMKTEHGTEYKRHECPEEGCNERFRIFKGKLMRKHLELVHGQSSDVPKEMFPCEKCDKKFKTYEIMQKHLKGVHESSHVPCYICAKLVKEGTPMEHHIKYVHLRPNQFE